MATVSTHLTDIADKLKFSDDEKFLMMSEGRPETMQWLYLKPKL